MGQIRQTRGLASEDLIGFMLAADLPQFSLERKTVSAGNQRMGNLSAFFQEPVIMGMDDIIVIFIIITGGGGAQEVLSIICGGIG